ncbi:MAG TPA: ABC transporter permease subunit [Pyrinomonadaceae bacterium]|jgi:ABC-type transport system involved in multi-copper enzyme maturation permease subunit
MSENILSEQKLQSTNISSKEKNGLLRRILPISLNTFREAVRDRVLYNLVLFVLLITASAIFLGELTAGQEARTIVNFGLGAMLFFGAFISIFVGVSLVSKEIEKRTVYAIFSKPIGRGEFIVGKYLGLCLTLLVNVLIMGVGVSLALLYVGGGSLAFSIWGAILLIFLELAILTGVAILFSSFSSPALSALLSFLVFIIGHFSAALNDLAKGLGSTFAKYVFGAIYYIFPNLSHFSFITNTAHGEVPPASMILGAFGYTIVYVSILLVLTVLIFSRRNFK